VRKTGTEGRFWRSQGGFTLAEVMVTVTLMMVVLFALYGIFDMSIRIFSFGDDEVEAVENARLGMERMEREIRAAYPYDNTATPPPDDDLFKTWTPVKITFGNELTGDRRILCPAPPPAPPPPASPPPCEVITYDIYKPSDGTSYALGRASSSGGVRQQVVRFVDYANSTDTGLSFEYFTGDGAEIDPLSPGSYTESDVARVRVKLEIRVPGPHQDGTQTLTTDVDLRNR